MLKKKAVVKVKDKIKKAKKSKENDKAENKVENQTENKTKNKLQKEGGTLPKIHLTTEFSLSLHTNVGLLLFNGGWRYGKMGLVQFASRTTVLWRAYKADDPYAELYILKLYEAIEKTKEELKTYETNLETQMKGLRGFKFEIYKNPKPLEQTLQFATPYAYMGAMLVEQVDYLYRQLYTLQRLGMVPKDDISAKLLIRGIRNMFELTREWQYTGVTRKDILEKNENAQKAQALLGEIPAPILNNEIQFRFLPKLKLEGDNHAK